MNVRPKKSLGQHFLKDENIAQRIIESLNPEIPSVLEIGPGKGVLSKYLIENPAFDPWFIEIDRESVAYLKEKYPAIRDRLIEGDFLKLDLTNCPTPDPSPEGEGSKSPSGDLGAQSAIQVVGNFPYNISSQILFRVLEYRDMITEVTGMFQHEVATRITSPPGSKQYGILSVMLQAFYRVEYLFGVSELVFVPPPKVRSAVIRLVRNEVQSLDCDEPFWKTVVKTAFNQRRKTLRNSLKKLGPEGFSQWDDPIFDLRPERLGVSDFVRLAQILRPER